MKTFKLTLLNTHIKECWTTVLLDVSDDTDIKAFEAMIGCTVEIKGKSVYGMLMGAEVV